MIVFKLSCVYRITRFDSNQYRVRHIWVLNCIIFVFQLMSLRITKRAFQDSWSMNNKNSKTNCSFFVNDNYFKPLTKLYIYIKLNLVSWLFSQVVYVLSIIIIQNLYLWEDVASNVQWQTISRSNWIKCHSY